MVGEDVELLDLLVLDVGGADGPEDVEQLGLANHIADPLAGRGDGGEEEGVIAGALAVQLLLAQDVVGEGDDVGL